MKIDKRQLAKKLNLLSISITLIFAGLIIYSVNLQIINHNVYTNEVITNTIKQRKLSAPRGKIIDRNGIILASTEYQNDLYVIPHYYHDSLELICDTITIDCGELSIKMNKYPLGRLLIARNISDEVADNLKYISGLSIFRFAKRNHNMETATAHTVGYVGKVDRDKLEIENDDGIYADDDFVGQSGLEYVFDKELHGINGFERYVVRANGLELPTPNRFLNEKIILLPINGNELRTSIDSRLQLVLAEGIGHRNGAGVVLDVRNGEVLALYSSPGFDPKRIGASFGDKEHPLINRSLSGYAPGSVFKLVVALAALEMGLIKDSDTFNCPGYLNFGNRVYHCWRFKLGGHGKINLRRAIKESCDVFFFNLGLRVGLKNINRYAKMLGLSEYTQIDLNGESKGSIIGKTIYKGTTLNVSIGQGEVLISPLQLANAYATLINGGHLYSPRIVKTMPVLLKQNTFKPETIEYLKDGLWAVVNEIGGTASAYKDMPIVKIAGKTGSAQRASLAKIKIKDDGWFVSYAPFDNPQIVVVVFVEGGIHGSLMAPIAIKTINEYFINQATDNNSQNAAIINYSSQD